MADPIARLAALYDALAAESHVGAEVDFAVAVSNAWPALRECVRVLEYWVKAGSSPHEGAPMSAAQRDEVDTKTWQEGWAALSALAAAVPEVTP